MAQIENINDVVEKIPEHLVTYGLLFTAANRIQAVGDRAMNELTMRQQFLLVLLSLFEDYAPTLQELAVVFGSSYQNVKRMATVLEEKGYLSIRKDTIDRRKIRIDLNHEKYAQMTDEELKTTGEFMNELYSGISAEELDVLNKVLSQIDRNLERMSC